MLPKRLRDLIGLVPGEVDVSVDGAAIRVQPIAEGRLVDRDGLLVVPPSGTPIDDDIVRELRRGDQR